MIGRVIRRFSCLNPHVQIKMDDKNIDYVEIFINVYLLKLMLFGILYFVKQFYPSGNTKSASWIQIVRFEMQKRKSSSGKFKIQKSKLKVQIKHKKYQKNWMNKLNSINILYNFENFVGYTKRELIDKLVNCSLGVPSTFRRPINFTFKCPIHL